MRVTAACACLEVLNRPVENELAPAWLTSGVYALQSPIAAGRSPSPMNRRQRQHPSRGRRQQPAVPFAMQIDLASRANKCGCSSAVRSSPPSSTTSCTTVPSGRVVGSSRTRRLFSTRARREFILPLYGFSATGKSTKLWVSSYQIERISPEFENDRSHYSAVVEAPKRQLTREIGGNLGRVPIRSRESCWLLPEPSPSSGKLFSELTWTLALQPSQTSAGTPHAYVRRIVAIRDATASIGGHPGSALLTN